MDPPAKPNSLRYNQPQQQQIQIRPVPKSAATFEDISFSSFLKPKDQTDTTAAAAAEISIFDAHKYFSEIKKESHPPRPSLTRLSSVSSDGYGRNSRSRSFRATPTASSEASWNSQTGLLVNPPGSIGVSLKNNSEIKKTGGKNGIFRRKSSCCCAGGKSVGVKEAIAVDRNTSKFDVGGDPHRAKPLSINSDGHHIAQIHPHKKIISPENVNFPAPAPPAPIDPPRQRRISASGRPFVDVAGGFSFPVLKNPPGKPDPKGEEEEPPRDSLEVFQPNEDDSVNAARQQRFNPGGRVETTDDDLGSDASSDLFELESFSTNTTVYPTYRRRDSLDEALTFNARRFASANGLNPKNRGGRRSPPDADETPSVAGTECYAPSEVSIDWSVTTAEGGLDRASVSNFSVSASEIGGAALLRQQRMQQEEGGGKKKVNGGGGGGLLLMSCRDGKAVSVGPQPVKCPAAEGDGPPVHVGGRPPRATKTTTLGNEQSRRMSLSLAFAT